MKYNYPYLYADKQIIDLNDGKNVYEYSKLNYLMKEIHLF